MKTFWNILFAGMFFLGTFFLPGCGPRENGSHSHEEGKTADEEEHEESPSGASFKPGKGIILIDKTREILGLEIAEVTEEKIAQTVSLNVQIFGEEHRVMQLDAGHMDCDAHGSGFLPPDQAAFVKPKQKVRLFTLNKETMEGFVIAVQDILGHGEAEIILGVMNADNRLKEGEFVKAVIETAQSERVTVIPGSALLRTIEGTFVYVVNGNAYYRTPVKTGAEANGRIEITDGLYSGDQVVTKPVETLWLIELRATKGGGHCH